MELKLLQSQPSLFIHNESVRAFSQSEFLLFSKESLVQHQSSSLACIPHPTMASPLRNEFFRETSSIDCTDMITTLPRDDAPDGWLLSSPSTIIISKTSLSKGLPLEPVTYSPALGDLKKAVKLAASYQSSSKPLRHRPSTSSNSPGPGMMDDPVGSDSDTSIEDDHNYHASAAELWDTFWSPTKHCFHSPSCQVDAATKLPLCVPGLSSYNRNCASSNLCGLNRSDIQADLHRSNAIRLTRRSHQALPPATYSVFPPRPLAQLHAPRFTHVPHKSWPLRVELKVDRPLRRRAHTTPGAPANSTVLAPSSLSTCTTLDYQTGSSGTCTPLYMCLPPQSPEIAPPLMELMEKSVFDYGDGGDDDDNEDEEKSGIGAFMSKLHSRQWSSTGRAVSLGKASTKRPKRQSLKKCMSEANEAMKGVFGIKKSAV